MITSTYATRLLALRWPTRRKGPPFCPISPSIPTIQRRLLLLYWQCIATPKSATCNRFRNPSVWPPVDAHATPDLHHHCRWGGIGLASWPWRHYLGGKRVPLCSHWFLLGRIASVLVQRSVFRWRIGCHYGRTTTRTSTLWILSCCFQYAEVYLKIWKLNMSSLCTLCWDCLSAQYSTGRSVEECTTVPTHTAPSDHIMLFFFKDSISVNIYTKALVGELGVWFWADCR